MTDIKKEESNDTKEELQVISSPELFHAHISSLPPSCLVVIYFNAAWAEPCIQMSTVLRALAGTFRKTEPASIAFLSLDAEECVDISEQYGVTQVPYIVLQQDGNTLKAISGTDAAKVRAAVEQYATRQEGSSVLPPAQRVVKKEESPEEEKQHVNGDGMAKYAPAPSDPNTAPQFSDEQLNGAKSKEDLNQRLSDLVKAAPVMLFMKGTPSAPQCGFSRQTVSILRENGVKYGFFNILADDEVRQGLKEFSDWPTFPQVYVEGELVGGLDILKEELENDPDFLKDHSINK